MDTATTQTKVGSTILTIDEFLAGITVADTREVKEGLLVTATNGDEYLISEEKVLHRKSVNGVPGPAQLVTTLGSSTPTTQRVNKTDKPETTVSEDKPDESKGGKSMNIKIGDFTAPVPPQVVKQFPEEYANKEEIGVEDLDAMIATAEGKKKTGFEQYKNQIVAKANQAAEGAGADEGGEGLPNTEMNESTLFKNASGRKNRGPKTAAEKEADKANRKVKAQEKASKAAALESQLASSNEELKDHGDFVDTVGNLRDILAVYGGCVGVDGLVTTTNTRPRALVKNLVKPDEREYHTNVANPDKTKTGKTIEAKYAKGLYQVTLVESNPGAVVGFLMKVPSGIKPDHLNSLTNVITMNEIKKIHEANKGSNGKGYVTIAVDKVLFTQLLTVLNVPAYHVNERGEKDVTRQYFQSEPRMKDDLFWYSLKAYSREGKVTKLACNGYIPLATFNTATLAQTDIKALTQLLFGRSLTTESAYTKATKFSQLSPDSQSLFTGTEEDLMYTGFKETMNLPSYESTKTNQVMVPMKLPATKMSEPTDDKPATPQFVKSRFNEPGYQPVFAAKISKFKELLGTFRRVSTSTKQNETFKKTAYTDALLRFANGSTVRTSGKITS